MGQGLRDVRRTGEVRGNHGQHDRGGQQGCHFLGVLTCRESRAAGAQDFESICVIFFYIYDEHR